MRKYKNIKFSQWQLLQDYQKKMFKQKNSKIRYSYHSCNKVKENNLAYLQRQMTIKSQMYIIYEYIRHSTVIDHILTNGYEQKYSSLTTNGTAIILQESITYEVIFLWHI